MQSPDIFDAVKASLGAARESLERTAREGFVRPAYTVAEGVENGFAATFHLLDQWSRGLEKIGIPRSGFFEDNEKVALSFAASLRARGLPATRGFSLSSVMHALYSGFGHAAQSLPFITSAGLPLTSALGGGAQAIEHQANVAWGVTKGLVEGVILHGILSSFCKLPGLERASLSGVSFGGLALANELQKPEEDRDYAQVVSEALIAMGLSGVPDSEVPLIVKRGAAELERQMKIFSDGLRGLAAKMPRGALLDLKLLDMPVMGEGLAYPFSPNHLQTSLEVALTQVKMTEDLRNGNFEALSALVENPSARDKPELLASESDLRAFFEPLIRNFKEDDWKILTLLSAFHDVGRINPRWARDHDLNIDGLGLAHDFDGAVLLSRHPELLDGFGLSKKERALLVDLVKWHTLPGQYFFGEGGLQGYQTLLRAGPRALDVARVHGLIDVMSALKSRFVKPILKTHEGFKEALSTVSEGGVSLARAEEREAAVSTPRSLLAVGDSHGLTHVVTARIARLVGLKEADASALGEALATLDRSVIDAFQRASAGAESWYGTYVSMGLGAGLVKAGATKAQSVAIVMKAVACAHTFHLQQGGSPLVAMNFSNLSQAQYQTLIAEFGRFETVAQGIEQMSGKGDVTGLRLETNGRDALTLSYRRKGERPSEQVLQRLNAAPLRDVMSGADFPLDVLRRLEKAHEGVPAPENPLTVAELKHGAHFLSTASFKDLQRIAGIGPEQAHAIIAHRRERGGFGRVGELADVPGVDLPAVALLEVEAKLAQIVSSEFTGAEALVKRFFADLSLQLKEKDSDTLSLLQVMRDTVKTRPEVYTLAGDRVAAFRLDASRVLDLRAVYSFNMTPAARAELLRRFGVRDAEEFFGYAESHPDMLREFMSGPDGQIRKELLSGNVSGFLGVGWWEPRGGRAMTINDVIQDLGLVQERYGPGFLVVEVDPSSAFAGDFRVPTAFDGLAFREWVPTSVDHRVGRTSGNAYEVVTHAVPISDVKITLLTREVAR
jgi:Helix-hairpin-helix motif